MDWGDLVGSPEPSPSGTTVLLAIASPLLLVALFLLLVALVVGSVVALCGRVKKACRNKEECRQLTEHVNWLRDLLPLLRPASEDESGGAPATAQAVRTVLAWRLEATVREVDRLDKSCAMRCCCLFGFARCDALARRLERAGAAVDEAYVQVLPVVSQIDATQRVVQMLGALKHRTLSSQHGGGLMESPSSTGSH